MTVKAIPRWLLMSGLSVAMFLAPEEASAQEIDQVVKVVSDDWNSLEIVRLIIGLLTPAAMLFIGVWLDRRIKEFEHRQWSNQKVIEKRLEVFEKITPKLNDLMCYFLRIGIWKEHKPNDIVDMKRDLDKIAYIYAPLFSPEFLQKYNAFIGKCFATFRGAGKDAQLKAEAEYYRDAYVGDEEDQEPWQPEWNDCFTGAEEATDRGEVRDAYQDLVTLIARELGVGLESPSDAG
ncbi:MAG: hypothetical protein AAGG48_22735 [Planctomycetota bacterium]